MFNRHARSFTEGFTSIGMTIGILVITALIIFTLSVSQTTFEGSEKYRAEPTQEQ